MAVHDLADSFDQLSLLDLADLPFIPSYDNDDPFVTCQWREYIQLFKHLQWKKIIHRTKERLVVQAYNTQTHSLVVVKCFYVDKNPTYTRESCLTKVLRVPHTLPPEQLLPFNPKFGLLQFPSIPGKREDKPRHCKPKSWQMWLRILKQLFEALTALHAQKYAHLDIKPGNILYQTQNKKVEVFLIDFGVAESESPPDSEPSGWSGSLPYVDPVFIQSGLVSTKSDMWSVGVMLIRSLFKNQFFRLPYSKASVLEDALRLAEIIRFPFFGQDPKPRLFHEELFSLILKLLVVKQEDRLSSKEAYDIVCQIMEKTGLL